MREIKFRVYDKQSNQMIYLDTPKTFDNGLWFQSEQHIDSNDIVIMQYTGLKDVDEKEIYENDIVEVIFNDSYISENLEIKINSINQYRIINVFGYCYCFMNQGYCLSICNALNINIDIKLIGNVYQKEFSNFITSKEKFIKKLKSKDLLECKE